MDLIDRGGMRWPAHVMDVELSGTGPEDLQIDVAGQQSLWCLYRRDGIPVSIAIWDVSADEVAAVPTRGLPEPEEQAAVQPATVLGSMTVVICTRNRPAGLERALQSLEAQTDRNFSVLVVDNAPTTDPAADVVARSPLPNCRYVVEPRAGLSRARDRALQEMDTEYSAWLDDDEIADPSWIEWLRRGFAHPSQPDAVCGLMLPAELNTEAQVRFEQYGGFNKGRGLTTTVLAAHTPTVRSPLYPLPTFGSGGNMAIRLEPLRRLGGFDAGLGAGTRTHGGEETQVLARLLLHGSRVLHWPPAITWHTHRQTMEQLERQFYGYSAGLAAFYLSMIRSEPRTILEILKLVPQGLSDVLAHRGKGRSGDLPDDFPPTLLDAGRRGLRRGARLYLQEVVEGARKSA